MKSTRTVHLRSGGSITLALDGNLLKMRPSARRWLGRMLDAIDDYERLVARADDLVRWIGPEADAARNLADAYRPDGVP